MSERDTQFSGFAEELLDEMLQASKKYSGLIDSESEAWQEAMQRIIARCAYDLVLHTVWNIAPLDLERLFMHEVAAKIPDLTELKPEEESK